MISDRLKEERKRLGFNQDSFAAAAGVSRRAFAEWESEKSETSPTALQLLGLSKVGADIQYIVTGERSGHGIGEGAVHQAVLDAVELLSLDKKVDPQQLAKAVVKLCLRSVMAAPATPGSQFNITTNHGQVVEGGVVNQGDVNFGVGASKGKSREK